MIFYSNWKVGQEYIAIGMVQIIFGLVLETNLFIIIILFVLLLFFLIIG